MPVPIGGSKYFALDEVAALFPPRHKPSLETLRRYIRASKLGGRKVGGAWYVSERSIQVFLEGKPAEVQTDPGADELGLPGPT